MNSIKIVMDAIVFNIFKASVMAFIYLVFRNSYFLAMIIVFVKMNIQLYFQLSSRFYIGSRLCLTRFFIFCCGTLVIRHGIVKMCHLDVTDPLWFSYFIT